jgi:DNA relaxase NicK
MKTIIETVDMFPSSWKIETISSVEMINNENLYMELSTKIKNNGKFYTDSNGWLVSERRIIGAD